MSDRTGQAIPLPTVPAPFHEDDLRCLLRLGEERRATAGTRLGTAGARVEHVRLVLEGTVHLRTTTAGEGGRTVAVVCPGGMLGDIGLFRGGELTHDLVAGRPSALLLRIEADAVRALTHRSAGLAHRWMSSIICRLEAFERRALLTATCPLRARLATLLLDARRETSEGAWVVRLSQETLADLVGASRPAVTRAMGALREEGLVLTTYRCIEVRDLRGLAAASGQRPGPPECPPRGPRTFLA